MSRPLHLYEGSTGYLKQSLRRVYNLQARRSIYGQRLVTLWSDVGQLLIDY